MMNRHDTQTMPMAANHEPRRRALVSALIAAAAALVAIAIVYPGMMFDTEIPISNEGFALSDLMDQNVPLRVWGARSLAHGHLPLWYPGCSGGLPLAAIPEAAPYYPFSTMFYAALPPGPATAYTILFHLVLAGMGAAMLARQWGARLGGQMLAAVLMSVGLHLPAHMRQLNLMQAEAWIPWAWLFLDRLLIGPSRRDAAGLGFSLGMLGLAGHPEILHHAVVILGFWGSIRLAGLRGQWGAPRFWMGRVVIIAIAALIAAAIAIPNLGPICEMFRYVDRSQSERIAPSLSALVMLVRPMILGDPMQPNQLSNPFFRIIAWEQMLYIGLLPLGLAACALLDRSRRRLLAGLFVLAAISLLLVYASRWGATRWIVRLIPMESSSRFPQRYLWCFNMVVVIFAALGLDGLSGFTSRRLKFFLMAALLPICVADLANVTRKLNPTGDGSPWLNRPESLGWLEREVASPNAFGERLSTYGNLRILKDAFAIKPAWNPNPLVDTETHRLFVGDHPSMWGWAVTKGYVGMEPSWVGLVMGNQSQPGLLLYLDADWGKKLQDSAERVESFIAWSGFYGGRWLASPIEIESPNLRLVRFVPGRYFGCYLYENRAWAGPMRIAHELRTYETTERMLEDMFNRPPDTRSVRMLRSEAPIIFPKNVNSTALVDRIVSTEFVNPNRVTIDCEVARPGFLVLNQNYYPRWRARVDGGEPRRTQRVNVSQTAVHLDPGKHHVVFEYPGHFEKSCLLLGLIGISTAAIGLFIEPRRHADTKKSENAHE